MATNYAPKTAVITLFKLHEFLGKPAVALGPNHTILKTEHGTIGKTDIQRLTRRKAQHWRRREE